MRTEQARPSGREGFSLIEVLAAMLILSVGLLGLEALGITAARSLIRAGQLGEYTSLAANAVEQQTARIRNETGAVGTTRTVTTRGDSVITVVARQAVGATPLYRWSVTVTVKPSTTAGGGVTGSLGSTTMTSYVVAK